MSRFAVQLMVNHSLTWLQTFKGPEDMSLGRFLPRVAHKLSLREMASGTFMGYTIQRERALVQGGRWTLLRPCPPMRARSAKFCHAFFWRLRDIVFYDRWPADFEGVFSLSDHIFRALPEVYWYIEAQWPLICRMQWSRDWDSNASTGKRIWQISKQQIGRKSCINIFGCWRFSALSAMGSGSDLYPWNKMIILDSCSSQILCFISQMSSCRVSGKYVASRATEENGENRLCHHKF
jgi:hypothetical protein